MELIKTLCLLLFSICIGITGQFCLKEGVMASSGRIAISSLPEVLAGLQLIFSHPMIWLGLGLYALGSISWLLVLSRVDLSYAYPMMGFAYVITVALAAFIRHEHVSGIRWSGAALIAIGVILIGNEKMIRSAFEKWFS